jgi:hypothetical protein
MSRRLHNLTNQRFGRWLVVAIHPERKRYGRRTVHILWLCRCACGEQHLVTTSGLRSGHTTQCERCRREQLREQQRKSGTKHGLSKSRAFQCWANMLQRCYNPRHPKYADYGGREYAPITVCDDWHSFENFYADMGEPPPGKSIDRKNNDGDYEPGNCRWATNSEQVRNRRPRKTRIKLGDPKILARLKQYTESLARAGERRVAS